MVDGATIAAESEAATQTPPGAKTTGRSESARRHLVCTQVGHSLADAAPADGLRFRHELLAAAAGVAKGRSLGPFARSATGASTRSGQNRLLTRRGRQFLDPCGAWGKKTGPNPTDRRKAGSKHHILSDAQGIPLSIILTEANRHDSTQLLPLLAEIPPIAGKPGRPLSKPELVQADRGYDSQPHRRALAKRGIKSQIARRYTEHGSGLGKTRWVIERTIAWLHQFRRLRVRYERRPEIHEAFLKLGCALICWRTLEIA